MESIMGQLGDFLLSCNKEFTSLSQIARLICDEGTKGAQIYDWNSGRKTLPADWIPKIVDRLGLNPGQKNQLVKMQKTMVAEKKIKKKAAVVNRLIEEIDTLYAEATLNENEAYLSNLKTAIKLKDNGKEERIYPNRVLPIYGLDKGFKLSYFNWPKTDLNRLKRISSIYLVDTDRFQPIFSKGDHLGISESTWTPQIDVEPRLYIYEYQKQKQVGLLERLIQFTDFQISSIQSHLNEEHRTMFAELVESYRKTFQNRCFLSECDIWVIAKLLSDDEWVPPNFLNPPFSKEVPSKQYLIHLFKKYILDLEIADITKHSFSGQKGIDDEKSEQLWDQLIEKGVLNNFGETSSEIKLDNDAIDFALNKESQECKEHVLKILKKSTRFDTITRIYKKHATNGVPEAIVRGDIKIIGQVINKYSENIVQTG